MLQTKGQELVFPTFRVWRPTSINITSHRRGHRPTIPHKNIWRLASEVSPSWQLLKLLWYIHGTFYLWICLSIDAWVANPLLQLIMLLPEFLQVHALTSFGCLSHNTFLGHRVIPCLAVWGSTILSLQPQEQHARIHSVSSHFCQYFCVWVVNILLGAVFC